MLKEQEREQMLACGGLLAWWEPMAWSGVGSGWAMLQWPEMCHRIREEVGRSPQPLSLLLLDLLGTALSRIFSLEEEWISIPSFLFKILFFNLFGCAVFL